MKALYKYPQAEFPYRSLLEVNRNRSRYESEFELIDTGVFDENRYFDIVIEYAKADANDILIRITATNRGPDPAPLHLLPTVWFRNTGSWTHNAPRPLLRAADGGIELEHPTLGSYQFTCEGAPPLLFTENETNARALWSYGDEVYAKNAFHDRVIYGREQAV